MIRTDTAGDVAVVTRDRPARRNALTRAGLAALGDAVDAATGPVLSLHGAGAASVRARTWTRSATWVRTVADEIAANDRDAVRAVAALLRDPEDRTAQEERERTAFADLVAKRNR